MILFSFIKVSKIFIFYLRQYSEYFKDIRIKNSVSNNQSFANLLIIFLKKCEPDAEAHLQEPVTLKVSPGKGEVSYEIFLNNTSIHNQVEVKVRNHDGELCKALAKFKGLFLFKLILLF